MNRQRRKGSNWEREFVKLISQIPGCSAKRIAMSGAIGTYLEEPALMGDVIFVVDDFPKKFRVECKSGYGVNQITLKREWFDKIKKEAEKSYSVPLLALKFSNVREKDATKYVIAMDFDTFVYLIQFLISLKEKLNSLYK